MARSSLVLIAIALVSAGNACQGEDEHAAASEYFHSFVSIAASHAGEASALEAELQAALVEGGENNAPKAVGDFVRGMVPIGRALLADYQGLLPPTPIADAHEDFVSSFARFVDNYEALVPMIERAETGLEARRVVVFGIAESLEAVRVACDRLQTVAEREDIQVDIGCGSVGLPVLA